MLSAAPGDDPDKAAARPDAVTYRMPGDAVTKDRVTRSADWLKRHLVSLPRPGDACPIRVIAWKDPTLEPADPKLLAGYAITDTLWAARALTLFDPAAAEEMEQGLRCLGWPGNGLHDVLFHPIDKILHRSADEDIVHGFSLGASPRATAGPSRCGSFASSGMPGTTWGIRSSSPSMRSTVPSRLLAGPHRAGPPPHP